MAKCFYGSDCVGEATGQVEIRLWALGMPMYLRNSDNCIKMLSGVVVCNECQKKIKPADMLLPEGKERIASALMRVGRAVPDFENAKLHFIEIIDEPLDPNKMVPPGARVIEG